METELAVGNLRVPSGERLSGRLIIGDRPASQFSLPFSVINGKKNGPVVAIISGQHGTEYVGIATAIRLIRNIKAENLSGALIVVPVVNVPGFEQRTRLVFPYEDDFNGTRNLNRLWPGDPNGSLAHLTIHSIFENVVKKGQYLLDLHGGDIYEFLNPCTMISRVGNEKIDKQSKTLAEIIGYDYIVESDASEGDRGKSKTEAALIGIPTVVVETGDQGKYDENLVERALAGVMNVLKYLKMLDGAVSPKRDCRILNDMVKIKAKTGGLFIHNIPVGSLVKKGDKIGEVISINTLEVEEVTSSQSGLLIESFCNPAVNTGETLAEVALFKE